jgi:hypothetical protein
VVALAALRGLLRTVRGNGVAQVGKEVLEGRKGSGVHYRAHHQEDLYRNGGSEVVGSSGSCEQFYTLFDVCTCTPNLYRKLHSLVCGALRRQQC